MDPVQNLLNTTQRGMVDNAQKQSDHLRALRKQSSRIKKQRAGELDSSDFSGEMNEDLTGSMDPDLFGEGSVFQKNFEEAYEVEDEEDEEFYEDDEEFDEEPDEEEEEEDLDFSDEEVEERRSGSWLDYQEEETEEEAVPEPVAEEPRTDAPPVAVSALVEQVVEEEVLLVDMELDELPETETVKALAPELGGLFDRLIQGSRQEPAYTRLCNLLSRFGESVLRLCLREKVGVWLLEPQQLLGSHPLVAKVFGEESPTGACYLTQQRLMVIEQRCLIKAPRYFHPALFYFAHAFDHALGDSGFSSFGQAVKANYQVNVEGQRGHEFADCLAEVSPVRYFAQAVEAYLGEGECRDPLWTREDLHDFDLTMFQYVQYLLARSYR